MPMESQPVSEIPFQNVDSVFPVNVTASALSALTPETKHPPFISIPALSENVTV